MSSADRALDLSSSARLAMVCLGFVPAIHVVAVLTPVVLALRGGSAWLALLGLGLLYVLPPVMVRLAMWFRPLPAGQVALGSPAFLCWWFTAQCQIVFGRLPWLEELLRLVPALYSAWLRLWGARVGSLAYWSPGVTILDRSLVRIGDRIVFGAGARLCPHVLAPGPGGGRVVLHLAPITVGSDAVIGAYSTLLPGCVVAPGELTPPFRTVHASTRLEGGRRSRLPPVARTNSADATSR